MLFTPKPVVSFQAPEFKAYRKWPFNPLPVAPSEPAVQVQVPDRDRVGVAGVMTKAGAAGGVLSMRMGTTRVPLLPTESVAVMVTLTVTPSETEIPVRVQASAVRVTGVADPLPTAYASEEMGEGPDTVPERFTEDAFTYNVPPL